MSAVPHTSGGRRISCEADSVPGRRVDVGGDGTGARHHKKTIAVWKARFEESGMEGSKRGTRAVGGELRRRGAGPGCPARAAETTRRQHTLVMPQAGS